MRIGPARDHGTVGLVFVDGPQFAAQQPHGRIEPLQTPGQIGDQQVGRMAQPQVRPLVAENLAAIGGHIVFGDNNIAPPTERCDASGRHPYEHRAVVEPFATARTHRAGHPDDRAQGMQQHDGGTDHEKHPEQRPPVERGFLGHDDSGRSVQRNRGRGQHRQLAIDRHDAQRQHESEEHAGEDDEAVEAMERLAAEQQLEKQIEDRKTNRSLETIYKKSVHD